jgi:hypothetical protein
MLWWHQNCVRSEQRVQIVWVLAAAVGCQTGATVSRGSVRTGRKTRRTFIVFETHWTLTVLDSKNLKYSLRKRYNVSDLLVCDFYLKCATGKMAAEFWTHLRICCHVPSWEPISFSHLLYARWDSSVVPVTCQCCVCGILCQCRHEHFCIHQNSFEPGIQSPFPASYWGRALLLLKPDKFVALSTWGSWIERRGVGKWACVLAGCCVVHKLRRGIATTFVT